VAVSAALEGRVAIVTGAGRGLGRDYALLLAREGARVVVNDRGTAMEGSGGDDAPAQQVAAEIRALGGEAVANTDDVADWQGGSNLVKAALESFGSLDVLVNNAGIVRGAPLATMDESDWDDVVAVHMKGHFVTTRFAAAHWRERSKSGEEVRASIIHTTSIGGLLSGLPRQANYVAAKSGIAGFTVAAAAELAPYGVRVNAVAPNARTRLTLASMDGAQLAPPEDPDAFDVWDPANVAPLVTYLATAECPFTGGVFHVGGREIGLFEGWTLPEVILSPEGPWTVDQLAAQAPQLLEGRAGGLASAPTSLQEVVGALYLRHARS
jgi:NAD(P)-dependent dehydrogenase (short-subunit alcohol dehydrogenase family)